MLRNVLLSGFLAASLFSGCASSRALHVDESVSERALHARDLALLTRENGSDAALVPMYSVDERVRSHYFFAQKGAIGAIYTYPRASHVALDVASGDSLDGHLDVAFVAQGALPASVLADIARELVDFGATTHPGMRIRYSGGDCLFEMVAEKFLECSQPQLREAPAVWRANLPLYEEQLMDVVESLDMESLALGYLQD